MDTPTQAGTTGPPAATGLPWHATVANHSAAALTAVAGVAVIATMLHTVLNALLRHFFRQPVPGTDEYVTNWYLPAMALLGFYLAQRRREHIEAPIIFDRLPARVRVELQVLSNVLTAALCLGLVWYGLEEAIDAIERGLTGRLGAVSLGPVLLLVPLSFVLFAVQLGFDTARVLRDGDAAATTPPDGREGEHQS